MVFNHNPKTTGIPKGKKKKKYKMKSKFLFVFLLLGILNCEAQYFNANPYDYLQLALRWPNSYCLTHEGGCREIVPQYFTISYLHPMRRGGPDLQNCPSPFNMPNSTVSTSCIPIHFFVFCFQVSFTEIVLEI